MDIRKISLPTAILLSAIVLALSFVVVQYLKQQSIEKQQQTKIEQEKQERLIEREAKEQAEIERQQEARAESWVNNCITDAYNELKTLQNNFTLMRMAYCTDSPFPTSCRETYEEAEADAFKTYEREWVPQCKLGNRVFLDYEPYSYEELVK
ncbi:MAG: hypothetical protein HYT03_02675 [Candidatus Harrisonbacteria bacterium]|nr:hypothetical protein [Candidatus Harrisonbacteria bacterium]